MSGGFIAVMAAKRGAEVADGELRKAAEAICEAIPDATGGDIDAFLNSRYGELAAVEVLKGVKMRQQIGWRRARFEKHFAETRRKRHEQG